MRADMSDAKVFLIDDDTAVLNALSRLLREAGFKVETFQSPHEFLLRNDTDTPGCAVIDVSLGDYNGLDLQSALENQGDVRPIIFITGKGDIATSVQAMKAGAVDFLTKPVHQDDLIGAVQRALERDLRSRDEGKRIASISVRLASLTPREQEVLGSVVAGRLNKQIAAELGIAEKTVKVHRGRVMAKMAVRSVADLVRMAEAVPKLPSSQSRRK
jgi:FixJ family two-component response regulator